MPGYCNPYTIIVRVCVSRTWIALIWIAIARFVSVGNPGAHGSLDQIVHRYRVRARNARVRAMHETLNLAHNFSM